jgi:predicted acylesterase/phospholipase RssA
MQIHEKRKIGLVLSGGGIKAAAFHIGVCLALKEKGFKFAGGTKEQVQKNFPDDDPMTIRIYVGSSAGAFVSSILSAGYSLEALVNAFQIGSGSKPRFQDHSLGSLKPIGYRDIFDLNGRNLLTSLPLSLIRKSLVSGGFETFLKGKFKVNGLFTTKNLEKYLSRHALSHNDFKSLGVGLYIVGTQLNHTRKVIFGDFAESHKTTRTKYVNYAKISQAVAASTALPPVFAPYGIKRDDGKEMFFFDGEIRDTLSTHVAIDHGADLVIASYSVQPYHYTDEIGSLSGFGIPVILNQALYQVIQQKIDRHITHQAEIRSIYNTIDGYFKQTGLGDQHREKVLEIIRDRVRYKPQADYIYIHPRPQNYEMFFADHFSLNPNILEKIVKVGFKSAISVMRSHNI